MTSRTSSRWITRKPSGLSRSDASFARNFVGATPTDATNRVSRRMSFLIRRPISSASPKSRSEPSTSRNASSRESGSTVGV